MMKPAKARLALTTETLRSLSTSELAKVEGGVFVRSAAVSCAVTTCMTQACQNA
jgi:hypothetical protein